MMAEPDDEEQNLLLTAGAPRLEFTGNAGVPAENAATTGVGTVQTPDGTIPLETLRDRLTKGGVTHLTEVAQVSGVSLKTLYNLMNIIPDDHTMPIDAPIGTGAKTGALYMDRDGDEAALAFLRSLRPKSS